MLKKTLSALALGTSLLIAAQAGAETKGRIIPNGSFSLEKNGQVVAKLDQQSAVDETAMIICEGSCVVKLAGLSLVAADQAAFAVKENGNTLNLYVRSGQVDFVVNNTTRDIAFLNGNGAYVKSEGFIRPVSTQGNAVKGYMKVTEATTQVGVHSGSMLLNTAAGTETINAGYAYQLAANGGGAAAAAAGGGGGGAVAGGLGGMLGTGGGLGLGLGIGVAALGTSELVDEVHEQNNDDDAPASPAN